MPFNIGGLVKTRRVAWGREVAKNELFLCSLPAGLESANPSLMAGEITGSGEKWVEKFSNASKVISIMAE